MLTFTSPATVLHAKPYNATIQLPMLLPPTTLQVLLPARHNFLLTLCLVKFLLHLLFCVFLIPFLKFLHNLNLYFLGYLRNFFAVFSFCSSALASSFCSLMVAPRPDTTPSHHDTTNQTQTRNRPPGPKPTTKKTTRNRLQSSPSSQR